MFLRQFKKKDEKDNTKKEIQIHKVTSTTKYMTLTGLFSWLTSPQTMELVPEYLF